MPSYEVFRAEQMSNFIFLIKFYILAVAFIAIVILITYVAFTIIWYKVRSTRFYRSLMKGAKR